VKIAWITDIHLNFVDDDGIEKFCQTMLSAEPAALLVGGDIGEAPTVQAYLEILENRLQRPIYFVLGNHDFYQSTIAEVRNQAVALTQLSQWLHWLPAVDVVELSPRTALVGHDGWSDGRLGDFFGSPVCLNDYQFIDELRGLNKDELHRKLNALGDEAAIHLKKVLAQALSRFDDVIVLTHVPPFRESCLYQGKPGNKNWLPHFTCKAVGDVLIEMATAYPDCQMTVLCGHSHHAAHIDILPNLSVKTGAATYGEPQLQPMAFIT
jgi:predicted MPP superfamily phosphohydrolase